MLLRCWGRYQLGGGEFVKVRWSAFHPFGRGFLQINSVSNTSTPWVLGYGGVLSLADGPVANCETEVAIGGGFLYFYFLRFLHINIDILLFFFFGVFIYNFNFFSSTQYVMMFVVIFGSIYHNVIYLFKYICTVLWPPSDLEWPFRELLAAGGSVVRKIDVAASCSGRRRVSVEMSLTPLLLVF